MDQLEILELRSNHKDKQVVYEPVMDLIETLQKTPAELSISICQNQEINTDYCIHVKYSSNKTAEILDVLINEIHKIMRLRGLVYHSQWTIKKEINCNNHQ